LIIARITLAVCQYANTFEFGPHALGLPGKF